jgi:pSer/pThr/pTyr-binding forkhead associated (FHA) protein
LNQNGFVEVAVSDRRKVSTYLVYGLGDGRDQVVIWDTRDVEVGRSKNQDIMLSDPEVSREHTLFRKDGERYTVQDRGTGLGTLVNGERISSERELQPGDVVRIGPLELKFGNTTQTIRPGENVRFASELKASHLAVGAGAAGRTMLAFKPEDDLALGAPTAPPAAAPVKKRAVSFDGTFEEMDGDDPLGVEDYDAFISRRACGRPERRGGESSRGDGSAARSRGALHTRNGAGARGSVDGARGRPGGPRGKMDRGAASQVAHQGPEPLVDPIDSSAHCAPITPIRNPARGRTPRSGQADS